MYKYSVILLAVAALTALFVGWSLEGMFPFYGAFIGLGCVVSFEVGKLEGREKSLRVLRNKFKIT